MTNDKLQGFSASGDGGVTKSESDTAFTQRQPRFVVDTPYAEAPRVVCYHDTLTQHLPLARHDHNIVDMGHSTLREPTLVAKGTSNPGYIAYVNLGLASSGSNAPFVVFVDPSAKPLPTVASLGYRRDYKNLETLTILLDTRSRNG